MSHHPHGDHLPDWAGPSRPPRRRHTGAIIAGVTGLLIAVTVVIALLATGFGSEASKDTTTRALTPTGEINQMGMPVMSTPGSPSGTTSAGGVEVTGARWQLGRVPLNVAVRPTWTLRNTSTETVVLGQPRPEVRTGCCPGPAELGATQLAPGESTTLTFELSMHPGMDGPHDIVLHVPVQGTAGQSDLAVAVTGDFRS